MPLTGPEVKALADALLDRYRTPDALAQMLRVRVEKNLYALATGSLNDMVYRIIDIAEAEGWVEPLLDAASEKHWQGGNNASRPTPSPRTGPNPFTYGMAVPPEHFYGRARQRADIRHRIGGIAAQCVSVVGFRRSGKSSLLRYVRERIGEFYEATPPPIVVSLDLQHKRLHSPAGIIEGLRRGIEQQGLSAWQRSENDDEWAVQEGLERVRDTGRRLIVLIDEFEKLGNRLEEFQGWGEDWRAKASDGLFALVIATTRPLDEVYRSCGLTSPFGNIFTESTLGAMEPTEWQALVRDGFARGGDSLGESPPDEPAGIPFELRNRLLSALPTCGPFDSYHALQPLFMDSRIYFLRADLPQSATTLSQRIQETIDYLFRRTNSAGDNGLVLFLRVLIDQTSSGNACHRRLTELANELAQSAQHPAPRSASPARSTGGPDLALIDNLAGGLSLYTQMAAFLLWRDGDPTLARAAFAEEARPFFVRLWHDLAPAEQQALRHAAGVSGLAAPGNVLRHTLQKHGLLRADGRAFSSAFAEFVRGV